MRFHSLFVVDCLFHDLTLMAKPKQKDIPRGTEKKKTKKKINGYPEVDSLGEDDWMVVKKQRITILIPPLPTKVKFTVPDIGDGHVQEPPVKPKPQSQCSLENSARKQSVQQTEKAVSLSPGQAAIPPKEILHISDPDLTPQKPSSLSHKIASANSPHRSLGNGKSMDIRTTSKLCKGMLILCDGNALLNRRMRVSFLEKKLKRAGGLENWLLSLGLSSFVKVFKNKSVNKFQLANLTMKKLKDMGAYAVGPRRKLMHAIDCLCEPHCFQHA